MELAQAVTIVIGVLLAGSFAQDELEFRFSGSGVKSGRLEARYEGSWHVVDHNAFPWNTSQVVCRQMGYKYTCRVRPCTSLGPEEINESGCRKDYNTSIKLNIKCDGTEETISTCLQRRNEETFSINAGVPDAGVEVTCADDEDVDVRLEGGIIESEGFLQIRCRQNGSWFLFCADRHLDPRDGEVVCRHLGQKPLARVERRPYNGTEEVVSDSIYCEGDETHLLECVFNETQSNCSKTNSEQGVAWITCSIDIFYNDDNITICGSDHSCKNRCGSWSGTVDCKCDLACKGFGDCCYDFDSYCGNHTVKQRNDRLAFPKKVPAEDYTCFGTVYFRSMFYMVTKCLGSLEDVRNITTSQCENMVLDVDDLLACTPVFDSEGVVYKNVFCALCSDVPISEVTSWSLQIDKDYFKMNGTNRTATSMDSVGRYRFNSDRGKILIEPPETGHIGYPRWCTKYQEPFCKDLLNYTSTFFAPLVKQNIFTGEVFYYHNPLVHKCVFQDITSIRDLCSIMLFNCYDSQTKYDVCLGLSNSRTGDKSTYITLLFDFSNSYSLGMEDVGQSCTKPGEIFDIFLKKCRFLGCPADHKLHDNICEDHQSFAVRTCIMDIGNVQWPYDSVYLYKSPENMFDVFLSANGVLGALFLKIMLQEKLLLESMASSHNLICNVTSFVIGVRTVEEPECRKPSSFLQPFNLPVTYTPFFVYQHQPTLDEVYQETLVTQNCWKRYESDLRCDLANLESEEFEIIDHATILHNASGMLITIDNLKVNMDGTIEVCEDDFSISKNLIVSGTHTVGSVLSVGLLLVTLAIHIGISNLRTLIRICLLNIIAGLLVINVVLFFNDKLSSFLCMICSILSHFAWIYTFTWATNVFSIVVQTWGNKQQLLHMQQKKSKYLALYTVTSWVFPWVVIIASVFLYHCKCIGNLIFRYGEVHFCWISIGEATKFVLGIPIGVLLLLDVLILIMAKLDFSKRNPSSNSRGICGVSPPADYLAAITLFLSLHGVALIGFLHFLLRNALLELLFPLTLYMESLFIFGAFVPFRKIIKMLQLRVRNYFHRCRADTLENRVYANYNVNDVEQPHMMRRLDNILRK